MTNPNGAGDFPEAPEGGYFVMINHEETADHFSTLSDARTTGQRLCDEEEIPSTWSIEDAHGTLVEMITRTDGRDLSEQIKSFNASVKGDVKG